MKTIAWLSTLTVGAAALWTGLAELEFFNSRREHLLPAVILMHASAPTSLLVLWLAALLPAIPDFAWPLLLFAPALVQVTLVRHAARRWQNPRDAARRRSPRH